MVSTFFPPGRLDPVLDGGVRDEDAVVAPEVPTGSLVGQAIFGDETDGPLLDTTGVLAVRQSEVGDIDGKATRPRAVTRRKPAGRQALRERRADATRLASATTWSRKKERTP